MASITLPSNEKSHIDSCFNFAHSLDALYFGLTNGTTCTVGNASVNLFSDEKLSNEMCYYDCGQNFHQSAKKIKCDKKMKIGNAKCGSATAMSIYQTQNVVPVEGFKTNRIEALKQGIRLQGSKFVYVGCYLDVTQMALTEKRVFYDSGPFGINYCNKLATNSGSKYFSLKDGENCYFDKSFMNKTIEFTKYQMPDSHCSALCGTYQRQNRNTNTDGSASDSICGSHDNGENLSVSFYERV